jgi:RimJ/RimL family protein N-acetyltransferase
MTQTKDLGLDCPQIVIHPGGTWVLTDGVVTLEPLREQHIAAVTTAASDPKARRMLAHAIDLSGPVEDRRNEVWEYLLGPWAYTFDPYVIRINNRKNVIAGVRWLDRVRPHPLVFSCGGWIHARFRHQGYGSKALALAVAYAHHVQGAEIVSTATRTDNLAAQANLASVGFIPDTKTGGGGKYLSGVRELCVWTHHETPDPKKVLRTASHLRPKR